MSSPEIHILIMAAGAATRFGGRKQLAPVHGVPMIKAQCQKIAPLFPRRTHVILGAYGDEIKSELPDQLPTHLDPNWELGLGHAISHGVNTVLKDHQPDGLLISLCDQIYLKQEDYMSLVDHYDPDRIICCDYGRKFGVPALFPAKFFPDISDLKGDKGAQVLLNQDPDQVTGLKLERAYLDIDFPRDLVAFHESTS